MNYYAGQAQRQLQEIGKARQEAIEKNKTMVSSVAEIGSSLFTAWSKEQNIQEKEMLASGKYIENEDYASKKWWQKPFMGADKRVSVNYGEKIDHDKYKIPTSSESQGYDYRIMGANNNAGSVPVDVAKKVDKPSFFKPSANEAKQNAESWNKNALDSVGKSAGDAIGGTAGSAADATSEITEAGPSKLGVAGDVYKSAKFFENVGDMKQEDQLAGGLSVLGSAVGYVNPMLGLGLKGAGKAIDLLT
jgi:hypothetical protein